MDMDGSEREGQKDFAKPVTGSLRKLLGGHGGWDCEFRVYGLEVEFKVSSCKRSISCKVGSGLLADSDKSC